MPYTQSLEIERRLSQLLTLIGRGQHSAPALAMALGVSVPTVSRCITALRERGHPILAVKRSACWAYTLTGRVEAVGETRKRPSSGSSAGRDRRRKGNR